MLAEDGDKVEETLQEDVVVVPRDCWEKEKKELHPRTRMT
jgi:hypothetical protein